MREKSLGYPLLSVGSREGKYGEFSTSLITNFIYYDSFFITTVFHRTVRAKTMYKSNYGTGPRNTGPREMTKVVCSDCGKECEVPFKPTEGRPVYCRDCLPKHRKPRY
jgi:CxxC-x17-CxxC domain-containing protein